jgi:hypothetical protein
VLLLRTHDRLENGLDSELEMALLRVWLDEAAARLHEFAVEARGHLRPPMSSNDRPIVEPGAEPPLQTRAEFDVVSASYASGDFLLTPVDLFAPRLVPEMLDEETNRGCWDSTLPQQEETRYLAETLHAETIGHFDHPLALESACVQLVLSNLRQIAAWHERCTILRALADVVMPRYLAGGETTRLRHVGRDALELEALKADFRQRLNGAWQLVGEALGHHADVQASCFALAEATAWLKAADSTLGRLAWHDRLSQTEERDEPAAVRDLGRRVLSRCHAQTRERLRRFDEDLAALRRGYYAPHVRAAALLRTSTAEMSGKSQPASVTIPGPDVK